MERRTFGLVATLSGLGMGLLGNGLFFGHSLGVSFPLYIGIGIALLLLLARTAGLSPTRRNLWPFIPVMFFAGMVALRADWMVATLNVAAALTLGGLALHYLALKQPIDTDSTLHHGLSLMALSFMVVPQSLIEGVHAGTWLLEKRRQRGAVFTSVVRGLVFAVPIIALFALLLGSADAVFARYVNDAFDGIRRLLGIEYWGDTMIHLTFIAVLGVIVTGGLGWGLMRSVTETAPVALAPEEELVEEGEEKPSNQTEIEEKRKPFFKLTMIESGIIMGSVAALFAAFVVIQFRYFFGGQETVTVQGMTYADYARRGFFELVAVSVLTLGMGLFLDRVTMRQGSRENGLFRVLGLSIAGLTGVMLVSAFQRMWLYEEEYGFTQLRVYTHVFMVWLGALFGVYALALFRIRKNVFSFGLLLVMIGYLATLNVLNVDAYIAERNIERYHQGHDLDIAFLNILSEDATAPILALYQKSEPGTQENLWSGQWLARHWGGLNAEHENTTIFTVNLSHNAAWAQLAPVAETLPVYDPTIYWTLGDRVNSDFP